MRDDPSGPDPLGDWRAAAVAKADALFASLEGGRLPAELLARYRASGLRLGWRLHVEEFSDGVPRELHVLVDGDYPYSPPRVALADGPGVLAWPHLEADGFLCILGPGTAVSVDDPGGVLESVLGEAAQLIEDGVSGRRVDDFRREFLSYWDLAAEQGAGEVVSLLEPRAPSRRIAVWRGKRGRVVGEHAEGIRRWLARRGAKAGKGHDYQLHDGALIWLREPLLPADYPTTPADMRKLVQRQSPEAVAVLEAVAGSAPAEVDVVLGAETGSGACFAATTVRPRQERKGRHRGNVVEQGFRPGHVPRDVLIDRYFAGSGSLTKRNVERADHMWIHGRDQDGRQPRLRESRVAILGCGSLGGPLARLVAQAGVGKLLLVDHERMEWPNVGRHTLGGDAVGGLKVKKLAENLLQAYPHLEDVQARPKRVGPSSSSVIEELLACDLVVSTMGNWQAECYLNDAQQVTDSFPPVVYGWVEPHAAAAHAVLVYSHGPCLRCGTDDKGHPHLRVTDWPADADRVQAPACGAQFTPYGPSEISWAHAVLSETVMDVLIDESTDCRHRIWIGRRKRVEAAGGRWAEAWIAEMGDPGDGARMVERPWPASSGCPACSGRAQAA